MDHAGYQNTPPLPIVRKNYCLVPNLRNFPPSSISPELYFPVPFAAPVVLTLLLLLTACRKADETSSPPVAEKIPHVTEVHGVTLTDDYHWLRDRENPKVRAHLEAENRHTASRTASWKPLREKLLAELTARAPEDHDTLPFRKGSWLYYNDRIPGKDFDALRRKPFPDGGSSLILDINERASGKPGYTFGSGTASPDGTLFAWKENTDGTDLFTIRVKNLLTGAILPDEIHNSALGDPIVWSADNRSLYYIESDEIFRPWLVKRHDLGSATDSIIYTEPDARFRVSITATKSHRFLLMTSVSPDMMETSVLPLDDPTAKPAIFAPRRENFRYALTDHGDRWFMLTNDRAINGRVIEIPVDSSAPEKEILPADESISYGSIESFATHLVLGARKNGVPGLFILDPETNSSRWITSPDPGAWFSQEPTPEFRSTTQRVVYETFLEPSTFADVDLATGTITPVHRYPVPPGFDPGKYRILRTEAPAKDGVKIPIWLLLPKAKPTGILLSAYGSYGDPSDPWFDSNLFSLLDHGVGFAIAQVRGGGDLGRRWYEAGRLATKQTTFDDYIACAEHLIAQGHSPKKGICGYGASVGGLLAGVVINQRPDLFRAFIADVPFVDCLNTMLDPTLPLTITEYAEWGNPTASKADFDTIRAYAPYENIKRRNYPSLLVFAGWNDSRVSYWEPAKWVSKLRAHDTGDNDILLLTNLETGHGGSSGRYTYLEKISLQYAFVIEALAH